MDFKNERLMMTEEEVRNRTKELLNEDKVVLIAKYMFLEQRVKNQKEVIDKINNYINTNWVIDNPIKFKNELLDILKEVSE